MIKIENNQINVYSKFDKDAIKGALVCFFLAIVITVVFYFITQSILFIILGIISIIVFAVSFYIYKNAGVEKLSYSLSEKEFIIYKRKTEKRYDSNKITSFAAVPRESGLENYVVLSYINEKGKNKSISFLMKGCANTEFVNLANNFLKKEEKKETEVKHKEIKTHKYNKGNSKQIIDNIVKNKQKIECTLIGKTKIFILNGKSYSLGNLYSNFVFVDNENNLFEIDSRLIDMDEKTFDPKYTFEMFYDKKKDEFVLEKTNNIADSKIINDFKEDFIYSSKLLFEKEEILNELNFYYKFMIGIKLLGIALLLSLCTIFKMPTFAAFASFFVIIAFGLFYGLYPYIYIKKKNQKK